MAENDNIWLQRARAAYQSSSNYFDTNIRREIERDLRQFYSKHPPGSKYYSDSYRGRSKLFRPKTRTASRQSEAVAAAAFFSTQDVVNVAANDDNDKTQLLSAAIMQELLQYRLSKSIPWFLTCIGAYQEAMSVGVVCSYQHWVFDVEKGLDHPMVELQAVENIRIAPSAKWYDPINTSPYVIRLVPMYVKDVKARMKPKSEGGEPKWRPLSDTEIQAGMKQQYDSIRNTREGNRTDSKVDDIEIDDFTTVWVHENFVEIDGKDYVYYTLGTEHMLTDPKPIKEVYHTGKRPLVMGFCILEAHKIYPSSIPRITRDVQAEINELANTRIDNIRYALNKRYLVRRNRQVDIRSLSRNVPGSSTLVNETDDVKEMETKDVTSSSYQEQDRLNLDFDDLTGHFSGSSVQSNRKLNETVGGMNLLSTTANQVDEYQLRTFVETWVEPVLRQLMMLEQEYESDETVLVLAGVRAKLPERFSVYDITDEMLRQELTLTVNVGVGATNPATQVERFMYGMNALREIFGDEIVNMLDLEEITSELFGKLGYKDGKRFFTFNDEDPRVAQLMQMIQQLQQALAAKEPPELTAAKVKEIQAKIEKLRSETVKTGVEAEYAAMQGAEVVASIPEVTPIADQILANANPQLAIENGQHLPTLEAPISGIQQNEVNTSPALPPVAAEGDAGAYQGIETQRAD